MRKPRAKINGEAYYHLVSRCVLKSFLFKDDDKEMFVRMMRRAEYFSGLEIMSFCVMSNHFHILVHVPASADITEKMLIERVAVLYGDDRAKDMAARWNDYRNDGCSWKVDAEQSQLRKRMGDISPFMQTLKQRYSVWYRSHHGCQDGTIWQSRFNSTIIEGTDHPLSAVSAYIDLNPVRAGIVQDPKNYRWSSYGAAVSGDKKSMRGLARIYNDNAAATDFNKRYAGNYRELLYLKGTNSFNEDDVRKVIEQHGKLPIAVLLRCKVRYFTSGVFFGSDEFVDEMFAKNRQLFSEERKTGARGIGICEKWNGVKLYSARKLRKSPVMVPA